MPRRATPVNQENLSSPTPVELSRIDQLRSLTGRLNLEPGAYSIPCKDRGVPEGLLATENLARPIVLDVIRLNRR